MAFQHQVLDTIVAMKAALQRRADTSDSEDSNADNHRPPNLKRKQRYTRHGQLDDPDGPPAWKRKVEHAGYNRYVINRNAPRFDIDGDIVPPPEDEEENGIEYQDWTDVEDNIYSGVDLEEIFAPLTTAGSLPEHPALSLPYTSKHLTNLTEDAAELVRKEQVSLWNAKNIMLKLRGDMPWVPCGVMETQYDRYIKGQQQVNGAGASASVNGTVVQKRESGQGSPLDPSTTQGDADRPATNEAGTTSESPAQNIDAAPNADVDMADSAPETSHTVQENGTVKEPSTNGGEVQTNGDKTGSPGAAINGNGPSAERQDGAAAADAEPNGDAASPQTNASSDASSQPIAHRMTTRARAQEEAAAPSDPTSPLPNQVHPFFNFPMPILLDPNFGLPSNEAEETRTLLLAFIQKHEEIVRNSTDLYQEMLKADKMRKEVYKWCKADAHVGEMSDGEDWYDQSEWGLDAPLIKGRDEEEEAQTGDVGKKTRQRRTREER